MPRTLTSPGQAARDEHGELVADDLAGQIALVSRTIAEGSRRLHDVLCFTWYIAGLKRPASRRSARDQ